MSVTSYSIGVKLSRFESRFYNSVVVRSVALYLFFINDNFLIYKITIVMLCHVGLFKKNRDNLCRLLKVGENSRFTVKTIYLSLIFFTLKNIT